jgi:hypothetical protein
MDEMRKVAFFTVGKATAFGLLAIVCVMVGVSYRPTACMQTGGILMLLMTIILLIKARGALSRDYKRTEMWLLLPDDFRPPEAYAQWATATVMRDAYLTFAMIGAGLTALLFVLALVFRGLGFR